MADKENQFNRISISIASPEQIKEWAKRTSCKNRNPASDTWSCPEKGTCDCGEIKKAETINYRSFRPEHQGLFCEATFGPQKDFECSCGKYKRIKHKGLICDQCGVEVTKSQVRRERLGYIRLATPVSHIWFFKGIPSRIGQFLELASRQVERVLYFEAFIVTEVSDESCGLAEKDILTETEMSAKMREHPDTFKAGTGAEAIQELLRKISLPDDVDKLTEELEATSSRQKKMKLSKQLRMVAGFNKTQMQPEWMILDVLPVISPDLRPLVSLEGGRFATSDLNDLYRRVINRNNRLQKLIDLRSPEVILRNEKRMLQESVDAFLDNGRHGRQVTGPGKRALKSLSDILRGKVGRFRQNLLGKRVDYSGRSVIVVGPELELHQCGLPKLMAVELFKPFIIEKLLAAGHVQTIKRGKHMTEHVTPDSPVWEALEEVIADHPVLLNRPPTLHRLGIQAFMPVLVEGKSIRIPPLVCKAFNADFDGDQMAVHVPLSIEARAEAKMLLLSSGNILKPSHGEPITVPELDMILGASFLTKTLPEHKQRAELLHAAYTAENKHGDNGDSFAALENETWAKRRFTSVDQVTHAHGCGTLKLHDSVLLFFEGYREPILTTVGRVIFNEVLPFTNGTSTLTWTDTVTGLDLPFFNEEARGRRLSQLVKRCFNELGTAETVSLLDRMQKLSFEYATRSGISPGIRDYLIPLEKKVIIELSDTRIKYLESEQELIESVDNVSSLLAYRKETQCQLEKNERQLEELPRLLDNFDIELAKKLHEFLEIDGEKLSNEKRERMTFYDVVKELLKHHSDLTVDLSTLKTIRDAVSQLHKRLNDRQKDLQEFIASRNEEHPKLKAIRDEVSQLLKRHSDLPKFMNTLDKELDREFPKLMTIRDEISLQSEHHNSFQEFISNLDKVRHLHKLHKEVLEHLKNLDEKLSGFETVPEELKELPKPNSELQTSLEKIEQLLEPNSELRELIADRRELIADRVEELSKFKTMTNHDKVNLTSKIEDLINKLRKLKIKDLMDCVSSLRKEIKRSKTVYSGDLKETLNNVEETLNNVVSGCETFDPTVTQLEKILNELIQLLNNFNFNVVISEIKRSQPIVSELLRWILQPLKSLTLEELTNNLDNSRKLLEEKNEEDLENDKILIWFDAVTAIEDQLFYTLPSTATYLVEQEKEVEGFSPVHLMADSGARARKNPFIQISAIVGLKSKQSGEILSTPIQSSYREGLDVLDYFTSTYGSRKGLVDTAMKTAASGYLTRKLVDVAQDVMITEEDCGTTHGILKFTTSAGAIGFKISGRVTVEPVVHPETEETMAEENTLITPQVAQMIEDAEVPSVRVRSILTCEAEKGACATCYGADLTSGQRVNVGEAIGIIAAQSIGEPGTQLTMRTFHTGGVVEDMSERFARKIPAKTAGIARFRDYIPGRTVREEGGLWIAQQVAEHLDQPKYKIKTVQHPDCKLLPGEFLTEKQYQEYLEKFLGFQVEPIAYEITSVNRPDIIEANADSDETLHVGQKISEHEYYKFSNKYSLFRCSEAQLRVESVKHPGTSLKEGTYLTESEAEEWRAEIRPFEGEWVYQTKGGDILTESEYKEEYSKIQNDIPPQYRIQSVTHADCPFKVGDILSTEEESQYRLELSEPVYEITEVSEGVDLKPDQKLTFTELRTAQESNTAFEVQRPSSLTYRVTQVIHPECPLKPGELIESDNLESLREKFSGLTADKLKYRVTLVHHSDCDLKQGALLTESEKKAESKKYPGFEVNVAKNDSAFEIERLYRVAAVHHNDFPVEIGENITQSESNRFRRSFKGFDFEKLFIHTPEGGEDEEVLTETEHKALVKQHRETDTPLPETKLVYHILEVHHEECELTDGQQIDETEYKRQQRLYKGFDTERVFKVTEVISPDVDVKVGEILSDADYKKHSAATSKNNYEVTKVIHPNCPLTIGQELKDWEYATALEQYPGIEVDGLEERFRIDIETSKGAPVSHLIPKGYSGSLKQGDKVKAQQTLAELHEKTTNLDIVAGIPRVTGLFEARAPKRQDAAEIAEIGGTIQLTGQKAGVPQYRIVDGQTQSRLYSIPDEKRRVDEGDKVEAGQPLTDGYLNPHDILAIGRTTIDGHSIEGEEAVWTYLVDEVQTVYENSSINDKHVEVIVRQMLQKIKILSVGDTDFYENDEVPRHRFHAENRRVEEDGGIPATGQPVLQSISKASLSTESFISAASFQETRKVLSDAAVEGQTDMLTGLKENVILGRLIPAGTGFADWRELDVSSDEITESEAEQLLEPDELPEPIAEAESVED